MTTLLPPPRGPLTTYLHALLRTALGDVDPPALVGDAIAPEDSGWNKGQPGAPDSQFIGYVVLKAQQVRLQPRQPIGDDSAWIFPYLLTSWGAVREQADFYADTAAGVLSPIRRVMPDVTGVTGFGIQLVQLDSLGSADRSDQVTPPMWSRSDSYLVRLARAKTP